MTSQDSVSLDSYLEDLYDLLVKDNTNISYPTVAISTDKFLEQIPFEAFRREVKRDSSIYWIEEKDIYYSSNIERLTFDDDENINPQKGLLISFSNNETIQKSERLDELVYSRKEVEMINTSFCKGQCLVNLGGETNYDIDELDYSDIEFLHIASHAQSKNTNAYSNFVLIRNGNRVDTLFDWDLYKLVPNAKLVFLSACETAKGSYNEGIGIRSIAKHFKNNGRVISTFWPIADHSSYEFSRNFYSNFSEEDIIAAVNQSKRMMKSKYGAQPMVWSAFKLE